MTNRAQYAFQIERGSQKSIIERGQGHWRYMNKFYTSILPPTTSRHIYLISIKGTDVQKAETLQGALEAIGLPATDAKEACLILATKA